MKNHTATENLERGACSGLPRWTKPAALTGIPATVIGLILMITADAVLESTPILLAGPALMATGAVVMLATGTGLLAWRLLAGVRDWRENREG